MTTKRTDELMAGDRVRLPGGRVRTVAVIRPAGYVNYRNEPIQTVLYAEGACGGWSDGNTACGRSPWEVEV